MKKTLNKTSFRYPSLTNGISAIGIRRITSAESLLHHYPSDRRKTVRYSMTVPVRFQWRADDGRWHNAIGVTRDIGVAGLFVESASVPPVDSVLGLTLTLPATSKFDTKLHLSCIAVVRHVQQESCQTSGFGVVADFYPSLPMSTGSTKETQWRCS